MTATIALIAWIVNTAIGLVLLLRLLRARRRIPALAYWHLVTSLVGLGVWIAFVATGSALLAWTGFAVLTLHLTLGDTLMVKGWRRSNPDARGIVYFRATMSLLKRPLPLVHSCLSPLAWFPAFAAAVISS
ncbi:hypothetical protein SAMN04488564_109294 [Lentzea waywayandensis]|uniref:Uncharacterized protein n=1 Tax=Lentzea waywayandensis TaxID=84724 RepID=A0A1I6F8G8_9PSEU|nr:hypothetical protein [Lentzea waywayandensis]SFR26190.1 hypothetical protein SAMN04488564_109294 [Lentzea waywayandensis]